MRLVDADALIDSIKQYANEPVKLNDRRWNTRCTAIIEDMIGTVKLQPTIDAVPVVHGQWIYTGWELICTVCGEKYSDELPYMHNYSKDYHTFEGFEYCPHCGAKMDGGANNNGMAP